MMKRLSVVILVLAVPLCCNGDVSHKLPLSSPLTIPSPAQSLLPPTFENPIKDYTVGLVPPPVDNQLTRTLSKVDHHPHHLLQAPAPQSIPHYTPRFIAPSLVPAKVQPLQRSGSSHIPAHRQHAHHTAIPVPPQVHQPKTIVHHQQHQQPSIHHHNHHQQQRRPQFQPVVTQQIRHHIPVSTPVGYYTPVTHPTVHQHSASVYYASAPVNRLRTVAEHIHPTVVPSSGVRIIQTYPSVSYAATQHGSTLSLGNNKLEPDLVYVINELIRRHHV